MRMRPILSVLFAGLVTVLGITLLLVPTGNPKAAYKWVDKNGGVHFTQTPPPDKKAEFIKPPPKVDTKKAVETLKAQQKTFADNLETRNKSLAEAKKKQQEQADKKKRCEQVKTNLGNFTMRPHVRVTDKDGNVRKIGGEEREARIKEFKKQIEELCK